MKPGKRIYLLLENGERLPVVIESISDTQIVGRLENGDTITDTPENWRDNSFGW